VHGESMLQILLSAAGAGDKENRPGAKPRAGSVPPRTTTPNSGKGAVTPAVRPASSMGCSGSRSVSNKRPRLAETNGPQVPSFVPRSAGGGSSAGAGHPPSKIAMPVPVRGSSSSVLSVHAPRAVSATIPRQQAALGIGRPPSRQTLPRPQASSVGSAAQIRLASSGSYSAGRSVGSGLGTSTSRNPQTIAVKAKRARRESFRPRPSGDWKAVSQGRYGGLEEDALREEDEDT
jgi:Ase1/PRC1/MAP65 family protein